MKPVYFAVFTVSAGLIAFEVSLLQVLSIVQWHHFASLIISIALLGFGASGTLLSLRREWMLARFERSLLLLLVACSVAIAAAVPVSQFEIARFDSYLIFVQANHAFAFLLTCIVFLLPFLFGALAIGLAFVRFTDDIGRLYFWNLTGSGTGGALALMLMWVVDAKTIAPLSGLLVAVGVIALAVRYRSGGAIAATTILPLLCVAFAMRTPELRSSQFKDISRTLDLPDAEVSLRRAGPEGLVQVVAAPASRSAPGLSLRYTGEIPVRDMVFVNGDAVGALPTESSGEEASIFDYTTRALPYEMGRVDSVLVLSSATGEAVRHALSRGAHHVRAVERHSALTGLWHHGDPRVMTEHVAARTWLDGDSRRYDVIIMPDVGGFGGTVGLEEMLEHYLLTRDALRAAWNRLGPDGRLVVTAWMDYPYRVPLQVVSSLADAVGRDVPDPSLHIAAVRSWADATFVVSRTPLTPSVSDTIRAFGRSRGFDPLLLPGIDQEERTEFNELSDPSLLLYADRLLGRDREAFVSSYPFEISPTTDDRPFAMRFLRWSGVSDVVDSFGNRTAAFFGLGLFIALLGFVIAVVLSVVLIILPLFSLRPARRGNLKTFFYFGGLGLAYFLVEIVFIQRFTLFLGHPVYAAAAVITSMLIGSGIGSLSSNRLQADSQAVSRMATVAAITVLLYIPVLNLLLKSAISLPIGWRAAISLVLILPPAFIMGFPFPLGLRELSSADEVQVPWAWGVNGCLSVVAAAGAGLLAVELGFTSVLVVAAGSYGLAAFAIR